MIKQRKERTGQGFEIQFYSDKDGNNTTVTSVDTVEELAQFLARCCWGNSLGKNPPSVWKDGKKWCFNEYTPIDDN